MGKQLSIFRPDKEENVLVVNNHTSFHDLMQEKGNVINELVMDRVIGLCQKINHEIF